MDHSLYGYLSRQTTGRLLMLLGVYAQKDDPYEADIHRMIQEILALRDAAAQR